MVFQGAGGKSLRQAGPADRHSLRRSNLEDGRWFRDRRRGRSKGRCARERCNSMAPVARQSHEGQGILAEAAFIRRTETMAGVAPTTGCDASHISEQARMRYSAIYQLFSAAKR